MARIKEKSIVQKHYVQIWDWKEQPNFRAISEAIREIGYPTFVVPINTNSDEYAVLVANWDATDEEANSLYLCWLDEEDGKA